MAQKYYTSREAADRLGISTDELRQMMDRREIYGYRDGADWKFKVEDIDRLIKDRALEATSMAQVADEAADVLPEEMGKPGPGRPGAVVGGSDVLPAGKSASKTPGKAVKYDDLDMTLEHDVTLDEHASAKPRQAGDSAVDLSARKRSEEDLALGGSGKGSDVTLGGDSGISLVDPSDSGLALDEPLDLGPGLEESLELGEDDVVSLPAQPAAGKGDDDFLLTPAEDASDMEESESGSQVIALDTEGDEAPTMVGPGAAGGFGGRAILDEEVPVGPLPGVALGPEGLAAPLGGVEAAAGLASAGAPFGEAVMPEQPYTAGNIVALVACTLLLAVAGMFMHDLARNMGNWTGPSFVSSKLMDSVLGLFEK